LGDDIKERKDPASAEFRCRSDRHEEYEEERRNAEIAWMVALDEGDK